MDTAIWEQLTSGQSVDFSNAPQHEGRLDLRGLVLGKPNHESKVQTAAGEVAILGGLTELNKINWKRVDFTGSHLPSLRFHDCVLEDCLFDDCTCHDWRMWRTSFKNCTFRSADLRDSALGAIDGTVRNTFVNVDFTETDMRGTAYTSAEFSRCTFRNARLTKVDFQGSVFADCVFQGKLDEVEFYDQGFDGKHLSKNEMLRVDFSEAQFSFVEFRRLNLESIRFPCDDQHITVDDSFPTLLANILAALAGKSDAASRRLAIIIRNKQKWLGQGQRRGVISREDVVRAAGQQGWELVVSALRLHRSES